MSPNTHIKLSIQPVSNLLGAGARRMLRAPADGETNPAVLAALGARTDLKPLYRRLLKMALEQLQFLEQQIGQLD